MNHRGRPTPAAGSGDEGRAVTRHRVVAAVGWPKSAASAWRRHRRTAIPIVPVERLKKPNWIRVRMGDSRRFQEIKSILREHKLHTACRDRPVS